MNIPPNSQPTPINDPSIPPKDPSNAPIEKLPLEILGHIISFIDEDRGMESTASTKKPLTKITVDQAKQNSSTEIKEFVKGFSKLMDLLISKIVDENEFINDLAPELLEKNDKAIDEIKKIREEILAFGENQVLRGVNLLDVKSSMMDAKVNLAKLIVKIFKIEGTQRVLSKEDFEDVIGSSNVAKDILYLAECYLQIDERMPFEDGVPDSLIRRLIDLGDLPEAFRVAAFLSDREPFNFSQELFDIKIPEPILDKIERVIDTLPKSHFKTESLLMLIEKHLKNENPDKSLRNLEKISIVEHLKPQMYSPIRDVAFEFVSMGDFEKAEKIINNLPNTIKSRLLEIFEERKADRSIIQEFAGKGTFGKNEVQSLMESINKIVDHDKKVSVYKAFFNELFWNQSLNELDAEVKKLPPEFKQGVISHIVNLRSKYGNI